MAAEVYMERHGSVAEFIAACDKRRIVDERHSSSRSGREDWYKTPTYEAAAALAADGWPEGRERAEALSGSMVAAIAGRIQRADWVYSVCGGALDVGTYLAGDPECFMQQEVFETPLGSATRHVRILFNGSVSCAVDSSVITARGAAVAALADLLELAGIAVTVDVAFCGTAVSGNKADRAGCYVTVKRSDERADLARLMFYMGHPSAFRRLAFAWYEGMDAEMRRRFGIPGYYTFPTEAPSEGAEIVIPSGYYGPQWSDPTAARAYIMAALAKCGVNLREV